MYAARGGAWFQEQAWILLAMHLGGGLVGLLLDLDAESLTVYVNGVRQGVLVQPGVTDDMFALSCLPLRWAVELQFASVRIDGPLPPPS